MEIYLGIIVAILLFSFIVFFHELGHFSAARFFGVKVEEFGLGIPPKVKKIFTDKKGTEYTLNYLPIGGFVRLKGENSNDIKSKNDKDAFMNKSYIAKSVILLAGVFMNFLLASIIFTFLFLLGTKPVGINNQIDTELQSRIIPTLDQSYEIGLLQKNKGLVLTPVEGSLAESSGIAKGDILLSINNVEINSFEELTSVLKSNAGKEVSFNINPSNEKPHSSLSSRRDEAANIPPLLQERGLGGEVEIKILIPESGKIGTYVSENISFTEDFEYKYGLLESVKYGFYETYSQSILTLKGLSLLLKKLINPEVPEERTEALSQVKGPIGLVDIISNSLENGFKFLLILGAVISINLGVFNLLPIPALDGGRFLIISINDGIKKAFGKKAIPENTEAIIHFCFFMILIALSILIGYNDVINILNK